MIGTSRTVEVECYLRDFLGATSDFSIWFQFHTYAIQLRLHCKEHWKCCKHWFPCMLFIRGSNPFLGGGPISNLHVIFSHQILVKTANTLSWGRSREWKLCLEKFCHQFKYSQFSLLIMEADRDDSGPVSRTWQDCCCGYKKIKQEMLCMLY